jgi:hypothetical protein
MDQVIAQKELTELFNKRTESYRVATQQIFNKIPSITEAIYDLLGLPHENVTWSEIHYDDGLLIVQLAISYTPEECPAFVKRFAPPHEIGDMDDVERVEQMIRLGVPRPLAFGSKEDVMRFFTTLPFQPVKETPFIDDTLSEEQLKQLKLFQHVSSAKH